MATTYRDNADVIYPYYLEDMASKKQVCELATTFCPFLGSNIEYLTVKPLTGGLSNDLFLVQSLVQDGNDDDSDDSDSLDQEENNCDSSASSTSSSSSSRNGVLVRIHPNEQTANDDNGPNGGIVDRDVENKVVAWLSQQKSAPIFYGRFENGRVEEFYPNVSPLSCHDMPYFASEIAVQMAKFHTHNVPDHILPRPVNDNVPNHFNRIDSWFQMVRNEFAKTNYGSTTTQAWVNNTLQLEWDWLKHQLLQEPQTTLEQEREALRFIRSTVFTHMDCQSLNILKTESNNKLVLIDFEYSGWNPRAADIANTFCEFTDMNNICANFTQEYPSKQVQNKYLQAYLQESNSNIPATPQVLRVLQKEIGRFTLLSHMGWTIWGVLKSLQSKTPQEFDYLAYAQHRMDGYELFKTWFYRQNDSESLVTQQKQ